MRRYAVRFVVAVLTFALGVALSLVFGLFKSQDTTFTLTSFKRKPCPKGITVFRPPLLEVDSRGYEPLNLRYLGAVPNSDGKEHKMRFLVENRSGKTVSHYSINGAKVGDGGGFGWSSNVLLEPGESRTISFRRDAQGALTLRVDRVTYQDGSVWINPRELR